MSQLGHQRHFEGELVTSAVPSTPDVLLSQKTTLSSVGPPIPQR